MPTTLTLAEEDQLSTMNSETGNIQLQGASAQEESENFHDSFSELPENPHLHRHSSPAGAVDQLMNSRDYKAIVRPRCFKSGDDICLFFERFKSFVILSNTKHNDLSLLLLNYVEDDVMYRKLRGAQLTPADKADIDKLIKAYERLNDIYFPLRRLAS